MQRTSISQNFVVQHTDDDLAGKAAALVERLLAADPLYFTPQEK